MKHMLSKISRKMAKLYESVRCILIILCCVSGRRADCCRYSLSDCQDYKDLGHNISGVYRVVPLGMYSEMNVYCDQVEDGGGWIVIQRRIDGSVNFYKRWYYYEVGFGDIEHEYWIGLLPLWRILVQGHYKLRINIEDWDGTTKYAHYDYFMIDSPANNYTLHVHNYSGTAGDSLSSLNGNKFSTKDRDNDRKSKHCAEHRQGGWWYGSGQNFCGPSGLNGKYFTKDTNPQTRGIYWAGWKKESPWSFKYKNSFHYSFKSTEIKIKRV